jgi:hypothetical protein
MAVYGRRDGPARDAGPELPPQGLHDDGFHNRFDVFPARILGAELAEFSNE